MHSRSTASSPTSISATSSARLLNGAGLPAGPSRSSCPTTLKRPTRSGRSSSRRARWTRTPRELNAGEVVGSRLDAKDEAGRKPEAEPSGERMQREPMHDDSDHPNRHYRIFTTAHDEIVGAAELCTEDEVGQLRGNLDRESRALQPAVARLAIKLERLLLARQTRRWRFDLEEGMLDPARLARVVTRPAGAPRVSRRVRH